VRLSRDMTGLLPLCYEIQLTHAVRKRKVAAAQKDHPLGRSFWVTQAILAYYGQNIRRLDNEMIHIINADRSASVFIIHHLVTNLDGN